MSSDEKRFWEVPIGFHIIFLFLHLIALIFNLLILLLTVPLHIFFIANKQNTKKIESAIKANKESSNNQQEPAPEIPDDYFGVGLDEIENGNYDKALWARCLAESEGNSEKCKALYIKRRAENLSSQ